MSVMIGTKRVNAWLLLLLIFYILATFFVYQSVSVATPICFDDCLGYIPLMGQHGQNYIHVVLSMFRGWSVPVIFSLFGSFTSQNEFKIVIFQTYLAYFSWIIFACSCQLFLLNPHLKLLSFVAISLIMFGQGYYHLNEYLLSDSIALSSVLLQFSLSMLSIRYLVWAKKYIKFSELFQNLFIVIFSLCSAIEISARDSNLFLAIFGLSIVVTYNENSQFEAKKKILLTTIIVTLIGVQYPGASARHLINSLSILAGIVLPNPEIRDFFVAHGMPVALASAGTDMQQQSLDSVNLAQLQKQQDIVLKVDPGFVYKTDKIYLLYLITHPNYIIHNTYKYHDLIFDHPLESGRHGFGAAPAFLPALPGGISPVVFPANIKLSPMDHIPFVVMLVTVFLYGLYISLWARSMTMVFPLIFVVAGASNAILSFFGALWEHSEMVRHVLIGSIVFKIGVCLAILFFADNLLARLYSLRTRPTITE